MLEFADEEALSTIITPTETSETTTLKTGAHNVLGGIQPSGGERLIDLIKKIGANTKSKFNGDYCIS